MLRDPDRVLALGPGMGASAQKFKTWAATLLLLLICSVEIVNQMFLRDMLHQSLDEAVDRARTLTALRLSWKALRGWGEYNFSLHQTFLARALAVCLISLCLCTLHMLAVTQCNLHILSHPLTSFSPASRVLSGLVQEGSEEPEDLDALQLTSG